MTPPEAVEVTRSARPPHHWDPYLKAQAALAHHHQIPHIQTTAAFRSVYEARLPIDTADAARSTLFLDDLHPTALGCFSYWSQRHKNRDANHGLRLDYVVASQSMCTGRSGGEAGEATSG